MKMERFNLFSLNVFFKFKNWISSKNDTREIPWLDAYHKSLHSNSYPSYQFPPTFYNQQILIESKSSMIIRSLFSKGLKLSHQRYFSNEANVDLAIINYEYFFKEMQKSSRTQEAISLYKNYEKQGKSSIKYITITLRILTRLLKYDARGDKEAVYQFIEENMKSLKLLENYDLSTEELKDLTLFLLNYTEINSGLVSQDLKNFIRNILGKYIKMFGQFSDSQKLQQIQIVISSIKSIFYYFNDFTVSYVGQITKIFRKYPNQLICDSLTFKSAIQTFEVTYTPANIDLNAFMNEIAEFILKENLISTFEYNILASVISTFYRIDLELKNVNFKSQQVKQLISSIEKYFLSTFHTMNAREIEQILPIALKYNPASQFIIEFYSLLALSINQSGSTCLNPLFVVQSVALLTPDKINLFKNANKKWQESFIKFLHVYFHSQNKYVWSISSDLQKICANKLLSHQNHLNLLLFISDEYKSYKYEKGSSVLQRKSTEIDHEGLALEETSPLPLSDHDNIIKKKQIDSQAKISKAPKHNSSVDKIHLADTNLRPSQKFFKKKA